MRYRKRVEWTRLDNASKVFPSISNNKDTKVFRLVCELNEAVESEILQQALDVTIEIFPLYKSVLRRGVFWYYFETNNIQPVVEIESNPVCAPIYIKDRRNMLFRVFYYNNRINVEIFHALSDGTGALRFVQTLVYYYLLLRHKEAFEDKHPELNYSASVSKKMDDSFGRYFAGKDIIKLIFNSVKKDGNTRAYHIRGSRLDENRMKVIEGCMSAKSVLEQAHEYSTTLTIYIASLFIYSIYKEMPAHKRKYPVVLSVPINLRHFFESETTRNFFSVMNVGFHSGKDNVTFKDVIQSVSEDFRKELTEERLNERLNRFMALEKNPFARVVPLPFKDNFLCIANKIMDRGITAAISNLGRISMPSEFDAYIRKFSVFTSSRRPQICMCSYGDRLVVSFTSPFNETEIQRTFFEFLSKKGIDIEISSNL